jgi:S-DNA-T family DNA segregation ATPase FtsK/SpoIIIE
MLPLELALDACGIVSGERLVIASNGGRVLDVVAGVDAGTSHVVADRCVLGRGAAADVRLCDPAISRRHLALEISTIGVSLTPIGRVHINGSAVEATTELQPGDVIAIGRTQLVLRTPDAAASHGRTVRGGTIGFRRTPYRRPLKTDRGTVTIGPIPERHEPRRLQVLSIAGPLLAGLLLYAFMHRVEFLALTLLSPVLLVATVLDDRRAGRRSHRRQVEVFRSMLDERRRELDERCAAERRRRFAAAPDLGELARRAETTSVDLWERGADDDDFLCLRVGRGAVEAALDVVIAQGGEQVLREEAAAAVAGSTTIADDAITIDLAGQVLAVHGDEQMVDGLVTSIVLQAACLHSPDELAIVAAIGAGRGDFEWLKWLPHTRRARIARSRADADELVRAVIAADRPMLVVLDSDLLRDVASVAQLLEVAGSRRIGVVWIAAHAADVPRHARAVLEAGSHGRLWRSDSGAEAIELVLEPATGTDADRVARALAPIHDLGGGDRCGIASDLALLDVLGLGAVSASTVTRWWRHDTGDALHVPIGTGVDGPVAVDLVDDGPHMLIAGTTGSGKSELLQSTVTAIAARYSPQRVNFLFVDYKGGAATKVFERLPHTVGYVTNLDAALAKRALASLRAELERRMGVLEGRAKDIRELRSRAPRDTPPSLVVVIDEFATLAKQLPDFVAGLVDIAQRGRSLGFHLVLSTQRLAGAVDDNIVANTNIRIALRLLDRADSSAVVGCTAAADIPAVLRGRGICRIGSQPQRIFQSAYGGRPLAIDRAATGVAIADFADPSQLGAERPTGEHGAEAGGTQQQAVLAAIGAAAELLALPPPVRPWREPLPAVVTLDDVAAAGDASGFALGLLDAPERQQQGALTIDLERGGGCLIFGSGGSGKTTALRTCALALTRSASERDPVAILALDGMSRGLAALRPLPTVIDVAAADDLEAITRHIVRLDVELAQRQRQLSDAGAHRSSAATAHVPLPRIVVLIDDIGVLVESLGGRRAGPLTAGETWSERLARVLVEGRQVGIHGIITSDRRGAVPSRLLAAVSNRVVLGLADRAGYADHGVATDSPALHDLPPGRGWWNATTVVQLAVASDDHSAHGQRAAIERVAATCLIPPTSALHSVRLPTRIVLSDRGRASMQPGTTSLSDATRVLIGVEDVHGAGVMIDLSTSNVSVVGRAGSGRSTALRTIAAELERTHELFMVGSASSGLARSAVDRSAFGSADEVARLLDHITSPGCSEGGDGPCRRVLVIDDLDLLDEIGLAHLWDRVARDRRLRIVASIDIAAMTGFASNPVAAMLKRSRQMLLLQPDDPGVVMQLAGTRLDVRPGLQWVPGRGLLIDDRTSRVLQVALPGDTARRTPVRSRGTVSPVTVLTTQSIRTAAEAAPAPR